MEVWHTGGEGRGAFKKANNTAKQQPAPPICLAGLPTRCYSRCTFFSTITIPSAAITLISANRNALAYP